MQGNSDLDQDNGSAAPVVNSVVAALSILRLLARSDDSIGVTDIAKNLGIKRSSAFNILKTLTAEGFLYFNEGTKRYSLGPGALELARLALDGNRTFNRLRDLIAEVGDEFGGTSQLWRLRKAEDRLELVGFVESRAIMRIQMSVGQRLPTLSGAVGRAYAGYLLKVSNKTVRQRFERVRWEEKFDYDRFERDAKFAQKHGWAADKGVFIRGIMTVAAVVYNLDDEPEFFLSNSTFVGQHRAEDIARLGEALANRAELARKIIYGG